MTTNKISLQKNFDPSYLTEQCQKIWEALSLNQPKFKSDCENFCMLLPPPNVTGVLHMGHAFNQTIMDALARYHRMIGNNTLWIPGTDHAGIATQLVVERELAKEKKTKEDIGRQAFVDYTWQWKEKSRNTITSQIKKLGASVDWSREYFTLDETMSQAVNTAFVQLYQEGLIYRGKRLVNWDPILKTAISDLEVNTIEENGYMYHLRYPLKNSSSYIVVATTRPETIFGDVAVMVHPDDHRYRSLIGKKIILPIVGREITIISDNTVDTQLGTGAVKVTPAHDFNDYQVALRHGLPKLNIFTLDGKLNNHVPQHFQGMYKEAARNAVLAECQKKNILDEIKPHKLMVPRNERTGTIIEPMLTDQWFIDVNKPFLNKQDGHKKSIAEIASSTIKNHEIRFFPENWANDYNQWIDNLQDWCISRQLWWGHRIPAWYSDDGQVFVAQTEELAYSQAKHTGYNGTLYQDTDVLDTWFSSSLLPFSTLGWPKKTLELNNFLPSTILVTGFDILFFWVARMIMFTKYFTGKIPFKKVYIHGLIRDASGQKMSKSKGNTLDPLDIIEGISLENLIKKRTNHLFNEKQSENIIKTTRKQFPNGIKAMGTDALRFTFAATATMGRNISFDLERAIGYRNFCNKLWNATRFVLLNCQATTHSSDDISNVVTMLNTISTPLIDPHNISSIENIWDSLIPLSTIYTAALTPADKWIIIKFNQTAQESHDYFISLRFDLLAQTLYQFIWEEFCDWYLEMAKIQFLHKKETTGLVLLHILDGILRLLHPLMPFITESLWQHVYCITTQQKINHQQNKPDNNLLMAQKYPINYPDLNDELSIRWMNNLKAIVNACRNLRGQLKLSPGQRVPLYLFCGKNKNSEYLNIISYHLPTLAKISEIKLFENEQNFDIETINMPVIITLPFKVSLIHTTDVHAEKIKIEKELNQLNKDIDQLSKKLENNAFISRAPSQIVTKERDRMIDAQKKYQKLFLKLQSLS